MIISITHEHDLDGLGSQAIIKRYFDQENTELILNFAHYIDFSEKVKNSLKKSPEKLFITDLGFNEDFLDVFKDLKKASEKGIMIFWFDHHIVDKAVKAEIEDFCKIYINDTRMCAAEIVQNHFMPDDDIASKIAALAHDSDFKEYRYENSNKLQLIIEFNRGDSKINEKRKIVDYLSKGMFENEWFKSQVKELKSWYNTQSKIAQKNATKIILPNKQELIISFAKLGGGKITDLLRKKYQNLFAYVGIDTRFNEIIIYSLYFNCRDFARLFGGGGHRMRAGFKHKSIFKSRDDLNPTFLEEIKEKIESFIS
jgi:oligoribonuclease NrnB/cAMP/cGMP phosphodiesterase (DHH superfamily)